MKMTSSSPGLAFPETSLRREVRSSAGDVCGRASAEGYISVRQINSNSFQTRPQSPLKTQSLLQCKRTTPAVCFSSRLAVVTSRLLHERSGCISKKQKAAKTSHSSTRTFINENWTHFPTNGQKKHTWIYHWGAGPQLRQRAQKTRNITRKTRNIARKKCHITRINFNLMRKSHNIMRKKS